jgi:hypothetical protein
MIYRPGSSYFAKVFLNGQYVGRSHDASLEDRRKTWSSDEGYEISIPRGHRIHASRLAINLYQDNHGSPIFFGKCYLEGDDLFALVTAVADGKDSFSIEQLPVCDCRLYDINHQDLPYTLEIKGWRQQAIREDILPSRVLYDGNGFRLHRSTHRPIEIVLNILSIRNLGLAESSAPSSPKRNVLSLSPPDSPTFAFARQSAVRSGRYNYLVEVRWNQQRIFQYQGLPHPRHLSLFTPQNYALHECCLEILIWIAGKCVGSIVLSGDGLTSFLQQSIESRSAGAKAEVSDKGLWFPLSEVRSVPYALRADDLSNASLLISGHMQQTRSRSADKLVINADSFVTTKSNCRRRQRLVVIKSSPDALFEDNWRYEYHQLGMMQNSKTNSDALSVDAMTSLSDASQILTDRSADDSEEPAAEPPSQLKDHHLPIIRRLIEYQIVEHGVPEADLEEDRICWRGQLKPKEFVSNDDDHTLQSSYDSPSMFIPREKRLYHLQPLSSVRVAAMVTAIADSGPALTKGMTTTTISRIQNLPIVVREVTSHGPGLVRRHFRMEVSSHIGTKIGSVDVLDSYDDLRDIIGKDGLTLLNGPHEQWDMNQIFRYLIQERMIIDMKTPEHDDLLSIGSRASRQLMPRFQVRLLRDSTMMRVPRSIVLSSVLSPTARLQSIANPDMSYPSPTGTDTSELTFFSSAALSPKLTQRRHKLLSPKAMKALSMSSFPSIVGSSSNLSRTSIPKSRHWIRLCSKPWKMAGKRFGVVVLFLSDDIKLSRDTDDFFLRYDSGLVGLSHVQILFRCKDTSSERVFDLEISGDELVQAIDPRYSLSLSSRYRREKFGLFLVTYLTMSYEADGQSCKIGFNYAALRKGSRYLVHMKKERILNIDNSIAKQSFRKSEEEEAGGVQDSSSAGQGSFEDDSISIGSLNTVSTDNSHLTLQKQQSAAEPSSSSRKPQIRPLDILEAVDYPL